MVDARESRPTSSVRGGANVSVLTHKPPRIGFTDFSGRQIFFPVSHNFTTNNSQFKFPVSPTQANSYRFLLA